MVVLDGLSEVEVNVPFLGKVPLAELKKYVPLYLKLRKDPEFRDVVPKELDKLVMDFAKSSGLVTSVPKPRGIMDIDIPVVELHKNIKVLWDEGWSQAQIAKQLDVYPMVVHDFISGKSIYVKRVSLWSWLKGVRQRLRL